MESDCWQSKTEPLDSEYWEPFWAARIVLVGGVVILAAAIFRALRKREWNLAIGEVLADPSVELVDEHGMVLPHPLAGEAKQTMLLAQDGNFLAEIHEDKGRVGSIRLALITSEQVETNQT